MRRPTASAAAALLALCLPPAGPAAACPLCSTRTAEEVRAGLVDEHLPVSVAAVALPLAAAAVALGLVALAPAGGGRGSGAA